MVFVISLLGLVVHSDEIVETLSSPLHAELVKKFGNEKCENEKIGELSKDHVKCTQAINREDISEVNNKNNDFQVFVQKKFKKKIVKRAQMTAQIIFLGLLPYS